MSLIQTYSKHLKPYARELRKNMTVAEQVLWIKIRRRQICGVQFFRQRPIQCYIVDFYAKIPNLVIEVDGCTHDTEQAKSDDANKDYVLQSLGIKVLRFKNEQVLYNLSYVLNKIKTMTLGTCDR